MYIPELGTVFELARPWTFDLYHESRNSDLWGFTIGHKDDCEGWGGRCGKDLGFGDMDEDEDCAPVTLPTGSKMAVDRVYIRNGSKEFSSVTLRLLSSPDIRLVPKGKKSTRFWVKLKDFNTITVDIIKDTTFVKGKLPSCGDALTTSEFKSKLKRRTYSQLLWAKGTVNNKPIDEIVDIYYDDSSVQYSSILRSSEPSTLTITFGPTDKRENLVIWKFEIDSLPKKIALLSGETCGQEPAEYNHMLIITAPKKTYDLTFYKVLNP